MELNHTGQSAVFSLLGHKGDLIIVHFRRSFDELNQAELDLARTRLADYLEPTASYLSVVELGLYESSAKTYASLAERGIQPHTEEWKAGIQEVLARQSEAMHLRLFFPRSAGPSLYLLIRMDRRRGREELVPAPHGGRQRQMHEHGMIGRRYAGEVKQIISGSIGFDDWEWGVDLSGGSRWSSSN